MTITDDIIRQIQGKDRSVLARCITLLESTAAQHRYASRDLLTRLPRTSPTIRLGITGAPGVGKSTFIDAVGMADIANGKSICALTVDPSSPVSSGSILGDKTRMSQLSLSSEAYVRSSPSGTQLGGLSSRSYDVIRLCTAAAFDYLYVESVGVGQSELDIAQATDLTILLMQPGSGDDLQGIKKGIMEIADIIVITKDDGDLAPQVRHMQKHLRSAVPLQRREGPVPVLSCSALSGAGLSDVRDAIGGWIADHTSSLKEKRAAQESYWYEKKASQLILDYVLASSTIGAAYRDSLTGIHDRSQDIYQALDHLENLLREGL